MTCILRSFMYKGGPHLACGDVGISPYRRLSGERDGFAAPDATVSLVVNMVWVCGCGLPDRCRCTSATFVTSRKGGTLFLCATTHVVASTLVVTRLTDTNGITVGCCITSLVVNIVSAVCVHIDLGSSHWRCRHLVGTFHLTRFANDTAIVQTAYTSLTRWFSEARLVDFEARARVSINRGALDIRKPVVASGQQIPSEFPKSFRVEPLSRPAIRLQARRRKDPCGEGTMQHVLDS